jgi:hypothetical protein
MPLYNNASAVCTPMENAALQYQRGSCASDRPAKQELRVECNRAGHTYVEMGNDGVLAYQRRPEPSILSARHDHTKGKRSDPRTTLGRTSSA